MKFMLMMNAPRGKGDWEVFNWPPEDLKAHIKFMKRFTKELRDSGELVGAEGLAAPGQARVVRAGKGGAPEVTDGPFPEAKEFLAGYWILEALDADGRLAGHYRLGAVRAHLLEMTGDHEAAIAHYQAAAGRTTSIPERNYLTTQAARLSAERK